MGEVDVGSISSNDNDFTERGEVPISSDNFLPVLKSASVCLLTRKVFVLTKPSGLFSSLFESKFVGERGELKALDGEFNSFSEKFGEDKLQINPNVFSAILTF